MGFHSKILCWQASHSPSHNVISHWTPWQWHMSHVTHGHSGLVQSWLIDYNCLSILSHYLSHTVSRCCINICCCVSKLHTHCSLDWDQMNTVTHESICLWYQDLESMVQSAVVLPHSDPQAIQKILLGLDEFCNLFPSVSLVWIWNEIILGIS